MSQVVVEMSSDEAKLFRGVEKLVAQQAKLEGKFKATGAAAKGAGKKGEEAAKGTESSLASTAGSIATYAAGWLSVSAVIGTATRALREHAQVSEEALSSFGQQFEGRQKLRQVATSTKDFNALQSQADRLAVEHGTFQFGRREAAELVFSARSEGFNADEFAALSEIVDPRAAAVAAGQVPKLFGGKLTARESVGTALVAAGESRLNFEELTKSLPKLAGSATQAGASPEEALAVASVLASKFESGDTAGTRIGGLSAKLAQARSFESKDPEMQAKIRGLSGIGILAAVDQLSADDELRAEFEGGSKELFEAINAIQSERGVIGDRVETIKRERALLGTKDGILNRKTQISLEDAEEQAALGALRSGVKRELAEERRNVEDEGNRQEAVNDYFTDFENRGGDAFGRLGANAGIGVSKLNQDGPESTRRAASIGEFLGTALNPFGAVPSADPSAIALRKIEENTRQAAENGQGNFHGAANAQATVNQ